MSAPKGLSLSEAPFPPTSRAQWEEEATAQLRGGSLAKLHRTLVDGTSIAPIYHYEDSSDHPLRDGVPGEAPFHRGFSPVGWGAAGWGIASAISCDTVDEIGALLKEEVEQGATALRLSLDSWGARGERRTEQTEHESAGGGLPFRTASQLRAALEGISLPHITLLLDGSAASSGMLALFLASLDDTILDGPLDLHTLWDPLQAEVSQGYATSGLGVDRQLALLSEAISWFTERRRRWGARTTAPSAVTTPVHPRILGIDTTFIAEAGGGPVHELVWLGGALIEYIRILEAAGHAPSDIIAHTGAQLSAAPQFFVTTALFRAARIVVGTILGEYGYSPATKTFPLHALGLRRTLSRLDPHTNSLRVTAEVFGAAMGGATTITSLPFDGIGTSPSARGRRLARNTQLILRDEAQLTHVIDPAGGSWYLESVTEQLARDAWQIIQDIQTRGGMRRAVAEGYLQQMVAAAAKKGEHDSIARRSVFVGVNQYPLPEETLFPISFAPPTGAPSVITPVTTASCVSFEKMVTAARDGATLDSLMASCQTATPVMTPLLFPRREALPFETLRTRVTALPVRPRVLVCAIGDAAVLRARIDFCRDLLGLSGVIVEAPAPVATIREAIEALGKAPPEAIVLCAADPSYLELVEPFISELSARIAPRSVPVLLAGHPGEHEELFRRAGIHSCIHLRANPIELLSALIDTIGGADAEFARTSTDCEGADDDQ